MAAYSLDLRKRIVEAVERQVGSKREIARLFGVHESFLYKLLRQQRERGDLAPLPPGGGVPAKLSEEQWQQGGAGSRPLRTRAWPHSRSRSNRSCGCGWG